MNLSHIVADDIDSLPFLTADSILSALNCQNINKWPVRRNVLRQQSPESVCNPSFEAAAAALLCRCLWFASSPRFVVCQIEKRLAALEPERPRGSLRVLSSSIRLKPLFKPPVLDTTCLHQPRRDISATLKTRIRENLYAA